MSNTAEKLPGGCYLTDREELKKINTRNLNIIPFRKYRLDPEPVEMYEDIIDDDPELHWTEVGFIFSGLITLMVGCLGTGIGAILTAFLGILVTIGLAMVME